jgi:hypothetical protein
VVESFEKGEWESIKKKDQKAYIESAKASLIKKQTIERVNITKTMMRMFDVFSLCISVASLRNSVL